MKNFETLAEQFGKVAFEGKEYVLTSNAEFNYRSHNAQGWQLQEPNNWMSADAVDADGNDFTVWYYITDEHMSDEDMSNATDWDKPSDIVKA